MKLAIIGSRDFDDYGLLCNSIEKHFEHFYRVDTIVSGGASGADSLAAKYAAAHNIRLVEYLPDWKKHGRSAGFIRNEQIIANSDQVLAFWDGVSRGTQHGIRLASLHRKPIVTVHFAVRQSRSQDEFKFL